MRSAWCRRSASALPSRSFRFSAPLAGLVVEVAHAPVLERRDLVLGHAGHRGLAAADQVAVRGRGGGGPPVPPQPRQLHRDLARRIINWPPSFLVVSGCGGGRMLR